MVKLKTFKIMNKGKSWVTSKWSKVFSVLFFSGVFFGSTATSQVVVSDPGNGSKTIRMIKMKVDKNGQRSTIDTTFTQQELVKGDSMVGRTMIKRIDVENDNFMHMGGRCPMMNGLMGGDPFAFNPGDNSIVSYKRRHRGNGLEKITIIRKRHRGNNEENEFKVQTEVSTQVGK